MFVGHLARLQSQLVEALRAHLAGGKPRAPLAGAVIWKAFADLNTRRGYVGGLPQPISGAEVEAMERRNGVRWPDALLAILLAMDAAWLAAQVAQPVDSKAGAAPGAFDAMFG
jgi:hypothetical protein